MNLPCDNSLVKRIPYWDNLKGILIALVVFGHFMYDFSSAGAAIDTAADTIYLFHMPAFVFVSGFFSRSEKSRSAKSISKLAVLYLTYNSLMMVYAHFVSGANVYALIPKYSMWYLLALIIWRACVKYAARIPYILPASIILSLTIGFWSDINYTMTFSRAFGFFPFFLAGYLLNEKQIEKFINGSKALRLKGFLLSAVLLAAGAFVCGRGFLPMSNLMYERYSAATDAALRAGLLAFSSLMIYALLCVCPRGKIPILTKLGEYSLSIYIFHRIVVLLFARFFPAAVWANQLTLVGVTAAVSVAVLILFGNKYANKVVMLPVRAFEALSSEKYGKKGIVILIIIALLLSAMPIFNMVINRLFSM